MIATTLIASPRQPIAKAHSQQSGETIFIDAPATDFKPLLPLLRPPLPLRLRPMQRITQVGAAAAGRIFQNRHQQRGAGDRIRLIACGTQHGGESGITSQLRHTPSQRVEQAVVVQCPQSGQLPLRRIQISGGRLIQPLQLLRLGTAPLQQIQPQRREIAVNDFRFALRRRS